MSVHVLIVDDNLGLAALTVLMLAQAGMTSECIDNVETALALLEESNFTLLLVDEGLLGGSGIDLVAQVRSAGNSIPVIGMSGSGLGDEFRKAGANEFIAKPFRKEALLKLIDEVLESAELAAAGAI
jgi:DNA-binding NtrC family response regulator